MTDLLKYYTSCRIKPDAGDRAADHYVRYNFVGDLLEKMNPVSDVHLLDAGCGYGHGSIALCRRNPGARWQWHAVDIHEENITFAKAFCGENDLPVNFYVADLTQVPFADESMDVIFCLEVLNCSTEPEKIVAELRRVMKKGGTLILSAPNGDRWGPGAKRMGYPEGCRFFTVHDLEKLEAGLTLVKMWNQESYYYKWYRRIMRRLASRFRRNHGTSLYQAPGPLFLSDFPVTGKDPAKAHTIIAVYQKNQ